MNLKIDNLDGVGALDYFPAIDGAQSPLVIRKLNQPAELHVSLLADGPSFVVPAVGARVTIGKTNGQYLFSGYVMQAPDYEYLGWGERGPAYRYSVTAQSDEILLDEKRLPVRSPFVNRTGGDALRQMTQDLMPGVFDTSGTQDVDTLVWYASDPQKNWSQHAAEIAAVVRASYRTMNGALIFSPIGAAAYALSETDGNFSPEGLKLKPVNGLVNDLTVIGQIEPQAYVKDYFIGDGLTLKFYLSQSPFQKTSKILFDEEYVTPVLDPTRWVVTDPAGAISANAGTLQISGGTGVDGATAVQFVEKVELGGATVLQHGDILFGAASAGIVGGLYTGAISSGGCLAGFKITVTGTQSNIQAIITGAPSGTAITTIAGHHYVFTTRLYSLEIYQRQQVFHSSVHPAGNGVGGSLTNAGVRVVLEVQDIDPTNPASLVAPSIVLYDGVIEASSDFCKYAVVNATNMQCTVAFTRLIQAADAEVRTALKGQGYVTRLVGTLSEGAECNVTSSSELAFFTEFVPAPNQAITVRYRGHGPALARVTNPASIAALARGADNGLHGSVRHVKEPVTRTSTDCENAALAMLEDLIDPAWTGEYDTWSDFLPGNAADIFPGDALNIDVPSQGSMFQAVVREVDIEVKDLAGEHSIYKIKFANDAAKSLAFEFDSSKIAGALDVVAVSNTLVGAVYLNSLTAAEITNASSTTVTIDAGTSPPPGGGIEVRWSDAGWEPGNDRNLAGRFSSQTFTLPRLARIQNCFLRLYDASVPPKYSRYSAALHLDYPL
ncbi:MAG: hypothetical protein ACRD2U_07190 [Terriglobales bacterium]